MASQKRRSGGRTTPKGTKPGRVHETHRLDTSDTHSMHGQNIAEASSRNATHKRALSLLELWH